MMKPKFDGYAAQYDAWFMENDNLFQSELRLRPVREHDRLQRHRGHRALARHGRDRAKARRKRDRVRRD